MNSRGRIRQLFERYCIAIGIIVFLVGTLLRAISLHFTTFRWQLLGEFGTFLAVAVAIPFIYNLFLQRKDREIFLARLSSLLDEKLPQTKRPSCRPIFHEQGRRSIAQKVAFYEEAKSLVIEVGTGLRSFSGYFAQRPAGEFRDHITNLLRRGVTFKVLMLDPESEIARVYAEDRNEPEYTDRMRESLIALQAVSYNYAHEGLPGGFEVYTYSHFPYLHGVFVDPDTDEGYMFVSHYLFATTRADAPGVEFSKASNPAMFQRHRAALSQLLQQSRRVC